jgi:hypothetical protein
MAIPPPLPQTAHMRSVWLLIAIAVVVTAISVTCFWPRNVKVVVTNTGTTSMQNVTVLLTGSSYSLGTIAPGQSASVRVRPVGESTIKLQYTDSAGAHTLDADSYIEAGYRGRLELDVANGAIVRKVDAIKLGVW